MPFSPKLFQLKCSLKVYFLINVFQICNFNVIEYDSYPSCNNISIKELSV